MEGYVVHRIVLYVVSSRCVKFDKIYQRRIQEIMYTFRDVI